MTLAQAIAAVVLVALILYALLGGADFGGGVWDLFATGPRARQQRQLIAQAIGPIWEANHVWMILLVVLLFTAFPLAFFVIMTALHVPLTLMLLGIVLRGSAFVFRKLAPTGEAREGLWQRVFAVSSVITPIMLGVVLGTVSTKVLGVEKGAVTGGFFDPWLRPFPWLVGFFTTSLFAFLAAAYLTLETADPKLQDDFRARALQSAGVVALLGAIVAVLARSAAPKVYTHLTESPLGRAILAGGAVGLALSALMLRSRRFPLARFFAAGVVTLVLLGWGFGMHPWLVAGTVTIEQAAAPAVTLRLVAWILGLGSLVLLPAYAYLVLTFKRGVLLPSGRPPS